ncbi:unnamed protein product [Parnassius apollo]|uniref:(apollo) hypothetical protein n=1 Tax=Parnassius apollo TaxID=110799 RepID=A0A8S3YFI4_PARAO|nr:unnamed protein product [Parnassius apollo]
MPPILHTHLDDKEIEELLESSEIEDFIPSDVDVGDPEWSIHHVSVSIPSTSYSGDSSSEPESDKENSQKKRRRRGRKRGKGRVRGGGRANHQASPLLSFPSERGTTSSAGVIKDWLAKNAIQPSPGAKLNDDIPNKILPLRSILSGSSRFGGQGLSEDVQLQ